MPRLKNPECDCEYEEHPPMGKDRYDWISARQDLVALRGKALLPTQERVLDGLTASMFGSEHGSLNMSQVKQFCLLNQEYLGHKVR